MINNLITLAQDAAEIQSHTINPIGWTLLIIAIGGITSLMAWCIYKVVTVNHPEEHLHTQSDITPPDEIEEKE